MRYGLKTLDLLALLLSVAVAAGTWAVAARARGAGAYAHVTNGREEWLYPLAEDRVVVVRSSGGANVVVIRDGRIAVREATCRDQTCVTMGPVASPGAWIACLPNRLFIRVGGSDVRADGLSH